MDYSSLGARIRRERILRGWTQEQLAEKANISLSFLGHIERGTRKASLETLVALANVLDASVDELLTGSLKHKARLFADQLPCKKQTALQEILRTVEDALSTWSNED
jgi:transcriptional regulator with XRE-family HTH domain